MWKKFVTFLLLICSMQYVGTSKIVKRYVYSGSGTGVGAAGAGTYSDLGNGYNVGGESGFGYDFQMPFFQNFAPIVPPEFHKHFSDYFLELQKKQAALYKQQLELQQAIRQQAGTDYGYSAPSYAAASAYYNPSEIHQTAYISPPNPNFPNVDIKFASSGSGQPNNKFYGVSSSSFSESSDINGQKSSRRGAITTVNDNGKITTYKSHS